MGKRERLIVIDLPASVTPADLVVLRESRTLTALLNVAIAGRLVISEPKSKARRQYLAACLADLDMAAES